jgi:hypothetical protein
MRALLQESLCLHPLIRENHFLKAYLALERLTQRLPELDAHEVWSRLDVGSFPKTEMPICSMVKVPTLFAEREKRMLGRALFPSVYGIIRKKVEGLGAKAFLKSYLRLAIEDPEYLGFRFTVLVSFFEFWPSVEGDPVLRDLWIDRLTEFLMLSFNAPPTEHSLKKIEATETLTVSEVLKMALARPGFFGNHLIALATVKRFEKELLRGETQELLAKIKAMVLFPYADAEDFVSINPPQVTEPLPELEKLITNYLRQGPEDPHLIIFAEAMAFLWDSCDESERRWIVSNFSRFMRH